MGYLLKAWFVLVTLAMAAVPIEGIAGTVCQHEDCVNDGRTLMEKEHIVGKVETLEDTEDCVTDNKKLLAKEHYAGKVQTLDATEPPQFPDALRENPAPKKVRRNARNARKNSRR
mmetsp:Transcript_49966/g.99217  ORF Transcript_49966/g.99217 Transcript_49966/m.99217 type:complete len:115 (+) Transcript_49966:32-376(+)